MDLFANNSIVANLEVTLDGLNARNKASTGNLANVSTPGYKKQTVSFEEELKNAQEQNQYKDLPLLRTNTNHLDNQLKSFYEVKPQLHIDEITELHTGGNNVDVDMEMLLLAKTGMRFRAVADMAKRHFQGINRVIQGQ